MALQIDRDLLTGYGPIDRDHELMVDLIHELLSAVDRGQRDLVETALNAFIAKVVAHFDFEDGLMAEVPYAQTAEHKEAHASYLLDLRKFQTALRKKGVNEAFRHWSRGRLVSWFQLHIRAHDMNLARALSAPHARPR